MTERFLFLSHALLLMWTWELTWRPSHFRARRKSGSLQTWADTGCAACLTPQVCLTDLDGNGLSIYKQRVIPVLRLPQSAQAFSLCEEPAEGLECPLPVSPQLHISSLHSHLQEAAVVLLHHMLCQRKRQIGWRCPSGNLCDVLIYLSGSVCSGFLFVIVNMFHF